MKKFLFLALLAALACLWWRYQEDFRKYSIQATKNGGHYLLGVSKRLSGELVSDGDDSAAFEDVYYVREPVDTSTNPWNGILKVGTVVRKVGEKDSSVVIETGGGFVTVDPSKLTRDAEEIAALKVATARVAAPLPAAVPPAPVALRVAPLAPRPNTSAEAARIQKEITDLDLKISSLNDELQAKQRAENAAQSRGAKPVYGTSSIFISNEIARLQATKTQLQQQLNNLTAPR